MFHETMVSLAIRWYIKVVFKNREQLCVIELNEGDGNKITFERLAGILMDNPSNMVYCVKSVKLYGIISTGDIHRAKMMNRRL